MYANKKIITLINTDIYSYRNNPTPLYNTNEEFYRLYKLPENYTSIEHFNQVQADNHIKMPYQSGYSYRDPYTERRVTYESLMTHENSNQEDNLPKLSMQLNPSTNNNWRSNSSRVNQLISTHQAMTTFEYNWEAHKAFQESSNYIPLLFEPGTNFHDTAYQLYLKIGYNQIYKIQNFIHV